MADDAPFWRGLSSVAGKPARVGFDGGVVMPRSSGTSGSPGGWLTARHQAMTWCERNRVGYVFGLAGNQIPRTRIADLAANAAVSRVQGDATKVRRLAALRHGARTWKVERRVIARIEASAQGSDSRFIVTNLAGAPRWLHESVYRQRGQAESLIEAHKPRLASDRSAARHALHQPIGL